MKKRNKYRNLLKVHLLFSRFYFQQKLKINLQVGVTNDESKKCVCDSNFFPNNLTKDKSPHPDVNQIS